MRRLLAVGGALLGGVLLVPVIALAVTFGGLAPAEDGATLPGGARLVRAGVSNVYVLPTGSGVALVDCGDERDGAAIRAAIGGAVVEAIFLTHGHRDHLAACHQFGGARVYAMTEEVPVVEGRAVARGPVPRWRAPAVDLDVRVTHPVADGDVVRVGALDVRGFRVPGHTDGSAAWLAAGTLFVGDSLFVEADGDVRGAAWIFSDDTAVSRASMRALFERLAGDVRAVAPAHSGPLLDVDGERVARGLAE
ncbi:MAG: MBL fold metallo-hydrolase [Myxococcota bacterium]